LGVALDHAPAGRHLGTLNIGTVALPHAAFGAALVVDQEVERTLEGARQQLPLQINSEEPRAGINVLVARHTSLRKSRQTLEP